MSPDKSPMDAIFMVSVYAENPLVENFLQEAKIDPLLIKDPKNPSPERPSMTTGLTMGWLFKKPTNHALKEIMSLCHGLADEVQTWDEEILSQSNIHGSMESSMVLGAEFWSMCDHPKNNLMIGISSGTQGIFENCFPIIHVHIDATRLNAKSNASLIKMIRSTTVVGFAAIDQSVDIIERLPYVKVPTSIHALRLIEHCAGPMEVAYEQSALKEGVMGKEDTQCAVSVKKRHAL